jgi:hypothetical protein
VVAVRGVRPAEVSSGSASTLPVVGEFRWDTVADVWWWSEGLYRLYGYEPGAVEPTLERFQQHKDPRDHAQIELVFRQCLDEGGPFSCHHRIIDARGAGKTVVAIGFGRRDAAGRRTVVMEGFLVEVRSGGDQESEADLQALLASRAGIEQVKGALMLVHGINADAAFNLLRGYSQIYNKKLAAIVAAVLEAFQGRPVASTVSRAELDRILWDAAQS